MFSAIKAKLLIKTSDLLKKIDFCIFLLNYSIYSHFFQFLTTINILLLFMSFLKAFSFFISCRKQIISDLLRILAKCVINFTLKYSNS